MKSADGATSAHEGGAGEAIPRGAYLAAALDDEIVLFNPDRAALILLDQWAVRVWRACEHHGGDPERAALGPRSRVRKTLRRLAAAGVVRRAATAWIPVQVRWMSD